MFCPKCGQQQISDQTRFCSKCGFLMTGVTDLVENEGQLPGRSQAKGITPRRRGIYQGIFIFMLSFLVVPILAMITVALQAEPFAVAGAAVLLTAGGLLRLVYALMFESNVHGDPTLESHILEMAKNLPGREPSAKALPPEQSIPVSAYSAPTAGGWRDTNELAKTPGSVTDSTTKLLQKDTDQ